MGTNKKQIGGDHYKKHKIQPWDIVDEYDLNFYEGNALKYLLRRKGDRVEDLQKCIHYLEKEIANATETAPKEGVKEAIQNSIEAWDRVTVGGTEVGEDPILSGLCQPLKGGETAYCNSEGRVVRYTEPVQPVHSCALQNTDIPFEDDDCELSPSEEPESE